MKISTVTGPTLGLLVVLACNGTDKSPAEAPADAPAPPAASSQPDTSVNPSAGQPAPAGLVFDPATLVRGATVGTLTADMLTVSRAADSVTLVGSVRFSGELTLSGRTIPHSDSEIREVCFEADAKSAATMPRWSGDTRKSWFCFTNQEKAKQELAAPGATRAATVVVDRFTIQRGMSDQVNSAELVRVVSR